MNENSVITKIDYLAGGFQYKNNVLQFFPHAEGYVKHETNNYNYVFNYTDHLGNIRLSYTDINNSNIIEADEIVEENQYYPFGLKHETHNSSNAYQYRYNGKEYQNELSLNLYDYGARNYDPALGRWMNIDPLAEKYYDMSPYNYAGNVPTRFVDYDGKDFGITIDHENKTIKLTGNFYFNNNSDYDKNKKALESWNALSGAYTTEDGTEYAISVELSGIVAGEGESAEDLARGDSEGIGNYISEKSDVDFAKEGTVLFGEKKFNEMVSNNIGGVTVNGKKVYNKTTVANDQTRAHEIGHTLGFGENQGGVMNYAENYNQMVLPTKGNLKSILTVPYKYFRKSGEGSLNSPQNNNRLEFGKTGKAYNVNVVGSYQGTGNFLEKGSIILKTTN